MASFEPTQLHSERKRTITTCTILHGQIKGIHIFQANLTPHAHDVTNITW